MASIIAVALLSACSNRRIKGDGVTQTEERPISEFAALAAEGDLQITWTNGKPVLIITTDRNLLPLLTTIVTGNRLRIDSRERLEPTQGTKIVLSSGSLSDVQLAGDTQFTAMQLFGHDLKLRAAGDSGVDLGGSVTNFEVALVGDSRLNAKSFQAQTVTASLIGDTKGEITVTDSLKVNIVGDATLDYFGNPKSVTKSVIGEGRIRPQP